MADLQKAINQLEEERQGHILKLDIPNVNEAREIAILGAIAAIDIRLASLTTKQGMFPPPASVVFPHSSR